MAKLENPWRCDICKRIKEPTNGWLLGFPAEIGFSVQEWDEGEAEKPTVSHLCGAECSQRWTNDQLGKLVSK
jgi:hypothetical protein